MGTEKIKKLEALEMEYKLVETDLEKEEIKMEIQKLNEELRL